VNTLEFCHKKIQRDCDVKSFRLCALAFSQSGHLIASATNRTHGDGVVSDHSLHAEEFLVKKLKKIKSIERGSYISVLVVRWSKKKGWTMAKPCRGCEKLMRDYGITEISYTDETGNIKQL